MNETPCAPAARLLHPTVPPWQVPGPDGLHVVLLADAARPGPAFVRTMPDNEELVVPMRAAGRCGVGGCWQRWEARIDWDGGNGLTLYAFCLAGEETGGGHLWLAADGEHASLPPESAMFRVHRQERPPAWVREQVFYQVFPDRFARGAEAARSPAVPVVPWATRPTPALGPHTYWGGDLPGLTARLAPLHEELGVTALYLNPIFAAGSNHRYDTVDYTRVCPQLGGNAALRALREATRERGMRLVLDAVVNHTGRGHAWFTGAPRNERWYATGADGQPLGWKGVASLPVLDFAHPGVQQAVYAGEQAVLKHWLREPWAIDGWRLDVIHMLGEGPGAHDNARHVRAIRRAIKSVNPQAYVLGEHFAEATRWLQGDMEDGAMNYHGFTHPLRHWLAGEERGGRSARLPTAALVHALRTSLAAIPYENQLAQLNLLSSHDTPRWLTLLGGDRALMRLAFTLLFTWPGVPCVYYGDEIGLEGGPDPDCRRSFPWDRAEWDESLRGHVATLARWRRDRPEWRHGAWQPVATGADHWAFARTLDGRASLVVAHRGPATELRLDTAALPQATGGWRLAVGPACVDDAGAGALSLRLPGPGAVVLTSP
jgi:alpha-glucosidase